MNNGSVWIGKRAGERSAEHTSYSSGDLMVCNPELHPKCALRGPNTLSFEN